MKVLCSSVNSAEWFRLAGPWKKSQAIGFSIQALILPQFLGFYSATFVQNIQNEESNIVLLCHVLHFF